MKADDAEAFTVPAGEPIQKVTIVGSAEINGKPTPISFSVNW